MNIQPLPLPAARLLTSGQALTGPVSLVKELIDNAIDARATSIDVSISSNTVDKIEVRDNGHGIAPDDWKVLGKQGHTSKLQSFHELERIGGSTLGFRGQALAGAVELGAVTITTRTDGENIGAIINLGGTEPVVTKTSHPVGSTIRVSRFLSNLPVRRQATVRNAPKTLAAIKRLLQAYALARVSLRFTFAVLKDHKHAWSFAPRPGITIETAIHQVFGKKLVDECLKVVSPVDRPGQAFTLHAVLLKKDFDTASIGYHGQFISIDGRPVSSTKGIPRKIVSLYREYLRDILGDSKVATLKDPFLRLDIRCTEACYDVNVEPSKDEVLFEDEQQLMTAMRELFANVYGTRRSTTPARDEAIQEPKGFQLMLRQQPASEDINSTPSFRAIESKSCLKKSGETRIEGAGAIAKDSNRSVERRNQHIIDLSNDYEAISRSSPPRPGDLSDYDDNECAESSAANLNPWIIAKLTSSTSTRPRARRIPLAAVESSTRPTQGTSADALASDPSDFSIGRSCPLLLSPVRSRDESGTLHGTRSVTIPGPNSSRREIPGLSKTLNRSKNFATTIQRQPKNVPGNGLPLSAFSMLSPPTSSPPFDSAHEANRQSQPSASNPSHGTPATSSVDKTPLQCSIDEALDFENRKSRATRDLRAARPNAVALRKQGITMQTPSNPHTNRRRAALESLSSLSDLGMSDRGVKEPEPMKSSLAEDDPRKYLIRRLKSNQSLQAAGLPPKRMKSSRLPLERASIGDELHNLDELLAVDFELVKKMCKFTAYSDDFVQVGKCLSSAETIDDHVLAVREELALLTREWRIANEGADCVI